MNTQRSSKKNPPKVQVVAAPVLETMPQNNSRRRRRGGRGRGGRGRANTANQNGNVTITPIGRGLRQLGALAGSVLGQPQLGRLAGGAVSRIFGQGDYITNNVSSNSLLSKSGPPSFGDFTAGFRVKHREYLTDVKSSVDFASFTIALNPGLKVSFPWLSNVAANFEEYRFHGAVVYLNTTSGASVASTNTALGLWGVVTQYDPAEPDFTTKQQAENYVGCQSAVPSQSLLHGIECKPRSNVLDRMFVRTGALDSQQDLKFYDWGKTQVFTSGSQNANVIGEFWVSYDVEFYKPRLPTGGYSAQSDKFWLASASSNGRPLGSSTVLPINGSNLGSYVDGANNRVVVPATAPPGLYMAMWKITQPATFAAVTHIAITPSGACAASNQFEGNTQWVTYAPVIGVNSQYSLLVVAFTKSGTSSPGYLGFAQNGALNAFSSDIVITQVNSAFIPLVSSLPKADRLEVGEIAKLKTLLAKLDPNVLDTLLAVAGVVAKEEPDLEEPIQEIPSTKDEALRKDSTFSVVGADKPHE